MNAIKLKSQQITVSGIVQGVGFRPFVYQLAERFGLNGFVVNTSQGVIIRVEGPEEGIALFEQGLTSDTPLLAEISEISSKTVPPEFFSDFIIKTSQSENLKSTMISPDVSVCDQCLEEMNNPDDRRYRYPFINCTNCGPRYSIIEDLPYDRPLTTMKCFVQCHQCLEEYNDPGHRRFHAQPNACPVCGPSLALYDNEQHEIHDSDPLKLAVRLIRRGNILAVKGLGGYHLAVDASNTLAVEKLREHKRRGGKPFAVMADSMETVKMIASVSEEEEALMKSFRKPVVLLKKNGNGGALCCSDLVAPENLYVGVMLPYTPLHSLLFDEGIRCMVMTSGNKRSEPIAISNDEAFSDLGGMADYFLVHNRDICHRSDDSVVKFHGGTTRFLRRSRGYVPAPVYLKGVFPQVLACGSELKNTVCLLKDNRACLSQHIGDLDNSRAVAFLEKTVGHLERILDIAPEIVAHDLHPDYLSTRFAQERYQDKTIGIQHHHAHIVSCMAENNVAGPVIGLAFDGTGFGLDGALWGGEVLIADYSDFERAGHLKTIHMPGGESAIKEPWRIGMSYLYDTYGSECLNLPLPIFDRNSGNSIAGESANIIFQMIDKKINSPETSSMGRFFDGISAILGLRHTISFEGQAAIDLEMSAGNGLMPPYSFGIEQSDDSGTFQVLTAPVIQAVVSDLLSGTTVSEISGRFHSTVISMFSEVCLGVRKVSGINTVALSGGVFQNSLLLSGFIEKLECYGFNVLTHSKVPANDGGLSLGQAVIAASILNNRKYKEPK